MIEILEKLLDKAEKVGGLIDNVWAEVLAYYIFNDVCLHSLDYAGLRMLVDILWDEFE